MIWVLCWGTLVAIFGSTFRSRLLRSALFPAALLVVGIPFFGGCGRMHPAGGLGSVYVVSRGTYIRDRLAAIANHVEDVRNGERLTVLQHDRRFYQVRTPDGKVGWLEEHAVIDQAEYDKFKALDAEHAQDAPVASAVLRDEIFLHLTPGRKAEHLYLLAANDKLQLLRRASVVKALSPQAMLAPKPLRVRRAAGARPAAKPQKREQGGSTVWAQAPPHPDRAVAPDLDPDAVWMAQPMEDWWLVRDSGGKVGWVLARGMDVDVPDEVAQYSEGHRIVGAYLLNTVLDNGEAPAKHVGPEAQKRMDKKAAARAARTAMPRRHAKGEAEEQAEPAGPAAPVPVPHQVGQYVTLTSEFKDGLPYDWDQVRVFIWNARKHRYETAYRLREQQGYFPIAVGKEVVDKVGEEPTFTIQTTPDGVVTQDEGGSFHARTVNTTQYRLEGGIVRRDTPGALKPGEEPVPGLARAVPGGAGGKAAGVAGAGGRGNRHVSRSAARRRVSVRAKHHGAR